MARTRRYFRVRWVTSYNPGGGDYTGPYGTCAEIYALLSSTPLSRSGWTATADSAESIGEDGSASRTLDADTATHWHTVYTPSPVALPHLLTIDCGSAVTFDAIRIQNRTGTQNGSLGDYEIEVSSDGSSWISAGSGTANTAFPPTASATFDLPVTGDDASSPVLGDSLSSQTFLSMNSLGGFR